MNAEEIVQALRICNRTKGHRCSECPVFSRYAHGICKRTVDRTAANLIESLQAQLAESRRRERAAVKDLSQDAHCTLCKHHRSEGGDCIGVSMCAVKGMRVGWEWRGLQAVKGDAPNE